MAAVPRRSSSSLRALAAPVAAAASARRGRRDIGEPPTPATTAATKRWRGEQRRRSSRVARPVVLVLTFALLIVIIASALAMLDKDFAWLELDRCGDRSFSCGIFAGLLVTIVPLLLAYALLVFWRVESVRRKYLAYAQKHPAELVESGSKTREVVGRDDLCDVIQLDLQDRESRRPHVLVGGVGVGKTAVLVQLTRLLAEREAVPVPIRLRESQGGLDFHELARSRFKKIVESWVSGNSADEVWRKLRENDQIIVIADGL